ncbi:MAG: hypothetical protein WD135_01305, partial [Ferruginibacter sp.]
MIKNLFSAFLVLTAITAAFLLVRSNMNLLPNSVEHKPIRIKNGPAADFDKAVEEEYNFLKDPATGKIPSNAHELELKQAKEILEKQLLAEPQNSTTATTYVLQ